MSKRGVLEKFDALFQLSKAMKVIFIFTGRGRSNNTAIFIVIQDFIFYIDFAPSQIALLSFIAMR
jgi:hypothetical protein